MSVEPWTETEPLDGLQGYSAAARAIERPDEAWRLVDGAGAAAATIALWRGGEMHDPGDRAVARLGRYAARNADAGAELLNWVVGRAGGLGAPRIVGPMNGSTWFSYRLVTERGERAPMPLEPWTSDADLKAFEAAGFERCENYVSVATGELPTRESAEEAARAARVYEVSLRPFDLARFDDELEHLWRASLTAFADAPYFTPISLEDFRALYAPAKALIEPRFTTIAEYEGACAGFVFAFRDPSAPSLILKTLAVDPALQGFGVGKALTLSALAAAREAELSSAVFATMHERNLSASWAGGRGEIVRRYALFGRDAA